MLRALISLDVYLFSPFPSFILRRKEIDFVLSCQNNVNQADQLYVIEHIANTSYEERDEKEFARARWDVRRKQQEKKKLNKS